ncbi:gamma-butyrobetaine dioxygenase [Drosophila gunungcola]|uniref:gamma-butyrobetaine dioxygenase n=1 Tax=Drosophila gunungcola TaxID=103775 RepID=UPI0022E12DE4|nr:gamma-butyrobetaine dioxygenase [Drosophila gunungcola]
MQSCRQVINRLLQFQVRRASTLARVSGSPGYVEIKEQDSSLKYPPVWLRDNCQCAECFHAATRARKSHWERGPVNIEVQQVAFNQEQQQLEILWQDEHKSIFPMAWLRERDFGEASRKRYLEEVYKPPAQLWGRSEFDAVRREFQYQDVIQEDKVLKNWLEALAVQGFAILKNAPNDTNVAKHLAQRIGYIKRTTYGDVFEVKSKPNAGNYAYLMTPLPLHTDLPFYEYMAGINILHTLVQSVSKGGANTLTDGFNAAARLQELHPEDFEVLKTVPVNWFDIGHDGDESRPFHSLWRAPVICLDVDGRVTRINQNTPKRDSRFSVPLEQAMSWYRAYDKFLEIAQSEAVEFKTQAGDVFAFNNLRMLHGRTAYEDAPGNKRHLVGAYVDWDTIYSKLRTLKFPNAKD